MVDKRNNKNTPADTNVAEWIKADAGTGASIESGNHIWKPNWADFIKAHIIKKKEITSIIGSSLFRIIK